MYAAVIFFCSPCSYHLVIDFVCKRAELGGGRLFFASQKFVLWGGEVVFSCFAENVLVFVGGGAFCGMRVECCW